MMVNDLLFGLGFFAYVICWWILSTLFYWDFREVGIKNSLINFCKKNFHLNTFLAILFLPSIFVGLLSLRVEKWLVS